MPLSAVVLHKQLTEQPALTRELRERCPYEIIGLAMESQRSAIPLSGRESRQLSLFGSLFSRYGSGPKGKYLFGHHDLDLTTPAETCYS